MFYVGSFHDNIVINCYGPCNWDRAIEIGSQLVESHGGSLDDFLVDGYTEIDDVTVAVFQVDSAEDYNPTE